MKANGVHPLLRRLRTEPQEWAMRPATTEDDGAVSTFLSRTFGRPLSPAFLQWLLRENPNGSGTGWVAEVDRSVVAYSCWNPYSLFWNGSQICGVQQGPTAVAEAWRNRGLFLHLVDASSSNIDSGKDTMSFSLGQQTVVTKGLCRFFGWRVVSELVEYVLPLHQQALPDSAIPRPLQNGAAKAVGAALMRAWAKFLSWASAVSSPGEIKVQKTDQLDSNVESFLAEANKSYDWLIRRDVAYLRWRYLKNAMHPYEFYLAKSRDGVAGYMVLQTNHLNQGLIVDLFVLAGDRMAYLACLVTAIRYFLQRRVYSIRIHQQPTYWANPLIRFFLPFIRSNPLTLVMSDFAREIGPTGNLRRWHICLGDVD